MRRSAGLVFRVADTCSFHPDLNAGKVARLTHGDMHLLNVHLGAEVYCGKRPWSRGRKEPIGPSGASKRDSRRNSAHLDCAMGVRKHRFKTIFAFCENPVSAA